MTSADQVRRLLALVPYLRQHAGVPLATAARAFGVSERQLRSDLSIVWMCGLPGGMPGDLIEVDMEAVDGEGTITLTNADYLARPMRFTLDEALSLAVALRAVQEVADSATSAAVETALAKLDTITGAGETSRVAFSAASGPDDFRDALAGAIASGVSVRLTYDGLARAETTTPLVDPVQLAMRDGYTYLEAWSHERGGWRTYRLDRIAGVESTDQGVTEHGAPPDRPGGWLDSLDSAAAVTLDLDEQARWVTEYYPMRLVTPTSTGYRAELLVADPGWLRGLLLRLGEQVRVLEPASAQTSAVDAAAETLRLYAALEPVVSAT